MYSFIISRKTVLKNKKPNNLAFFFFEDLFLRWCRFIVSCSQNFVPNLHCSTQFQTCLHQVSIFICTCPCWDISVTVFCFVSVSCLLPAEQMSLTCLFTDDSHHWASPLYCIGVLQINFILFPKIYFTHCLSVTLTTTCMV